MLCKTSIEYIESVTRAARQFKPREIYMATFGLGWGNKDRSSVLRMFRIMNGLSNTKISVLVSCASEKHYEALQYCKRNFDNIKFVEVKGCHAKYTMFSDGQLWIGSANLTESGNFDVVLGIKANERTFSELRALHSHVARESFGYDSKTDLDVFDNLVVDT